MIEEEGELIENMKSFLINNSNVSKRIFFLFVFGTKVRRRTQVCFYARTYGRREGPIGKKISKRGRVTVRILGKM